MDDREVVVGYNSIGFDNPLCAAHGITIPEDKSYDLLVEIWKAAGLGPKFQYPTHIGFTLDAVCTANLGLGKTGHGALAPVQWQRGQIGAVIDYCLNDVRITRQLLERIQKHGWIVDPRDSSRKLTIKNLP